MHDNDQTHDRLPRSKTHSRGRTHRHHDGHHTPLPWKQDALCGGGTDMHNQPTRPRQDSFIDTAGLRTGAKHQNPLRQRASRQPMQGDHGGTPSHHATGRPYRATRHLQSGMGRTQGNHQGHTTIKLHIHQGHNQPNHTMVHHHQGHTNFQGTKYHHDAKHTTVTSHNSTCYQQGSSNLSQPNDKTHGQARTAS